MGLKLGRRQLLTGGAAAMMSSTLYSRGAGANFGDLSPVNSPWGPNAIRRPIRRVLEVFLYGGLSPWETFYVVPARATGGACATTCPPGSGTSSDVQWGTFRCEFEGYARGDTRRASTLPITQPFATQVVDGVTQEVHLGPATYPLWRSGLGILDRMQVLVMDHDLTPHEAAIPYSLTGTRLGRPTMCGTGAAVSRNANVEVPVSYVIKPQFGIGTDNVLTATATGTLGPAHKPLLIEVPCPTGSASTPVGPQLDVLNRNELALPGNLDAQDALLRYYIEQYRQRLTWSGRPPTRSAAFADYDATTKQFLDQLENIKSSLGGPTGYDPTSIELIRSKTADGAAIDTEPSCVVTGGASRCNGQVTRDATRQSLNFAGFLLNLPDTRYVCVIDVGEQNQNGAGYDTHSNHAQGTYRSLSSTLEVIANMLDPASPSPYKLDPYTMVVITTEFGRTPGREGGGDGRGHYPFAYTSVVIPPRINGPDVFLPPAKRVVGAINGSGRPAAPQGSTVASISPTDLRAALLLGLGVDPLVKATGNETGSIFGVGDLSERMQEQGTIGDQEVAARRNLVKQVLGYDT